MPDLDNWSLKAWDLNPDTGTLELLILIIIPWSHTHNEYFIN